MAESQIDIKERIKHEFITCAKDPVYFMKKYYMIQHPQRGRMLFDLYPFQEKVLTLFQKYPESIINKSRQFGISTLVSAYFQKIKTFLLSQQSRILQRTWLQKLDSLTIIFLIG